MSMLVKVGLLKAYPGPSGYVKSIQQLLKANTPECYRLLPAYDETVIEQELPVHVESELHHEFVDNRTSTSPESWVLEYHYARVWGNIGTVIAADNRVIAPVAPEFRSRNFDYQVFQQAYLAKPKRLSGISVLLCAPAGYVYGHFIMDVLPRICVLEKAGVDWLSADHILISGPYRSFQKQYLDLLGVPADKIVDCSTLPHLQLDTLMSPSPATRSGHYPEWLVEELRSKFLGFAKMPKGVGNKLFISRRNASIRRIYNEQAVWAYLEKQGFTRVSNEDYSVVEQIGMFQNAEVMIGPNGSSMCNLLFSKADQKVIETFAASGKRCVNVFQWAIGNRVPVQYGYILGEVVEDSHPVGHNRDYTIDIGKLQRLMKKMGI